MASRKIIAVLGATGNQGGSVVSTFLQDASSWQVRAITRDPSRPKARALAAQGADVVAADVQDPSSLAAAFEGVSVIFAMTDFWTVYNDPASKDHLQPGQAMHEYAAERETQQIMAIVDTAAAVPGLERFVLSSLSSPSKWSRGKYNNIFHFEGKAKGTEYCREKYPDLWAKTSVFQAGYFLQNYAPESPIGGEKNADGTVEFIGDLDPDVKIPLIAPEEDSGPLVKQLVSLPSGQNLIAYREWLTLREMADAFSRATGLKTVVGRFPAGEEPPYPPELKTEFQENFWYYNEFGYEGRDDPTVVHSKDLAAAPTLDTVENYIRKHNWGGGYSKRTAA